MLNWAKVCHTVAGNTCEFLHTSGTFLMSPPCSVEILTSPPRSGEYMWNWLHVDRRCTSEYDTNVQWRFCRNSLGLGLVCIVGKSCWTFELECIIRLRVYAGHRSTWKPAKCVSVYVCVCSLPCIFYVHVRQQARWARSAGNSAIENLCIIIISDFLKV